MDHTDTITAVATPPGTGGVGVIRVSGPSAISILSTLFRSNAPPPSPPLPESPDLVARRVYYGSIVSPDHGKALDDALVFFFKAPHSYTGEDVAEIQGHGSPAVLASILDLIVRQGARLAAPGEFTKRAYLNGRMDLSQAEAVMDLVNARTQMAAQIASRHIKGDLGKRVSELQIRLKNIMALVEADLDFQETSRSIAAQLHQEIIEPVESLLKASKQGRIFTTGLSIAVVGAVNVGKSSLVNNLSGQDHSIVTDIPGTTRDVIHVPIAIDGFQIVLSDTAGLRSPGDVVEAMGVERSVGALENADAVLVVVDASRPLSKEDLSIMGRVQEQNKLAILVVNKEDLKPPALPSYREVWTGPIVTACALTHKGTQALRQVLSEQAFLDEKGSQAPDVVPGVRQAQALEKAYESLKLADHQLSQDALELASIDLEQSYGFLGLIVGNSATPDILEEIFSRFCTGK